MKQQVLERATNACFTSAFLISFTLFGSLIEGSNTIKFYLAIAALPFASYALSELLLATITKKTLKEVSIKGKVHKNFALMVANTVIICAGIFLIIKYAHHGQINNWQYVFLGASVLLLQMFINAFWALMYQKQQLATELDRAARIIQSNNLHYKINSEEAKAESIEENCITGNTLNPTNQSYITNNQSLTAPPRT